MDAQRFAAAFEALDAYGCHNFGELEALLNVPLEWMHWDEIPELVHKALVGQVDHLWATGDRLCEEYHQRSVEIQKLLDRFPEPASRVDLEGTG